MVKENEMKQERLALLGGPKAVPEEPEHLFAWPILTEEDEEAVLDVLRKRTMSGTEITRTFEEEFASWAGVSHTIAYCNGTAALLAAMWACGVGLGDEIICPSLTFWASAVPALTLGAAVNFADIDPHTLCIDPEDIEHRIGGRTKAIVVVHYCAHPCDMDRILAIAKRHSIKVIEDTSHAQGSLYKGRMCGTMGDVGVMSLMSAKSFAIGEGGMLLTNDRQIFERCIAYGFYERTGAASEFFSANNEITDKTLLQYSGLPLGGFKHRMHQMSSAVGRVQLKHYPSRIEEIQRAMHYFWDLLADVPGLIAHRTEPGSGSTMGGWYSAHGLLDLDINAALICRALQAEGISACAPTRNKALHLHPVFHTADVLRTGKPTMIAFTERDVRQGEGSLPHAEGAQDYAFSIPWFKHCDVPWIERYAQGFKKVFSQLDRLRKGAEGQ